MAVDRSKYKKASSEEMAQQAEEMKTREQNGNDRATFLKVEPGINKFRIFPAPIKANSSLFCFPKVTSFLSILVDEYDEDGNKTGKQVEKRKAVFNAKVHGGLEIDIVEAYIEAAKEKFSATCKDKKELFKKLKPITDWKTGIKPSSAWICYAMKYNGNGKNKIYGRLQLTDGVKKQLDSLCLREGDSGAPITVDLFSDPDNGKPFQWTSNPNAEDAKQKNKVNILFEEDMSLTDEELEMLESWDFLESLYTNSYTKSDFEKHVMGLQRFDKAQNLNIFDSPSFQSIIESVKAEVDKMETNSASANEENDNSNDEEESTIPEILEEMDKKTLMSLPEALELDIEIKKTTAPSKIRQILKDAIIEAYELEGSNSEINASITDIIEESLGDESDEEDNDEVEGEVDNSNEEDDGDDNSDAEKEEEAPAPKKRESLLNKYRSKK